MIRSEAEYEGAQRELCSLKEFLSRVESAPDHPNKELGIIGIYKKMYHLWAELEEYYRARLGEGQQVPTEITDEESAKDAEALVAEARGA
jgi:hypothetical protein